MTMTEKLEVWITKKALVGTIEKFVVVQDERYKDKFITETGAIIWEWRGQFYYSRDKAIARAKNMKKAKLAELRKEIARIEALSFEDTPS